MAKIRTPLLLALGLGLALPAPAPAPAQAAAAAATPCGERVTALYTPASQGFGQYAYYAEVIAHRQMEVTVTMNLRQSMVHWPNGVPVMMPQGGVMRHLFAVAVGSRLSEAEVRANTTLLCRDLG